MQHVFYHISYVHDNRTVHLFGLIQNSFIQTVSELQFSGITAFDVVLLTAEEFNQCEYRPYTVPIK